MFGDSQLIVTCEECTTSFQLDESRLPETGARVRCSRCKHAFFLEHPSATQAQSLHRVAEEAAANPETRVPSPTEDLGMTAGEGLSASAPAPEPELDEEDWQFSEEIRIEGDEVEAEDDGADSVFGENEDFGDDFDESALAVDTADAAEASDSEGLEVDALADSDTSSGLELDSGPTASEPARDESSFGSVDDFSSLMEDEEPAEAVGPQASTGAAAATPESVGEAPETTYAASGQTDDLGDPESWDLVGDDDYSTPAVAPRSRALPRQPVDEREFFTDSEVDTSLQGEDGPMMALLTGPVAWVARTVGWVACVALIAMTAYDAVDFERRRWTQTPQAVTSGPLTASTQAASWVETAQAGTVLRFDGQVRNNSRESIWPPAVQLAWLDAEGERLLARSVPVGIPMPIETLREAAPAVLEQTSVEASRRFMGAPLAPGEVRGFEAIVTEGQMPEGARRFLLEIKEAPARRTPVVEVAPVTAPEGAAPDALVGETALLDGTAASASDPNPDAGAERAQP